MNNSVSSINKGESIMLKLSLNMYFRNQQNWRRNLMIEKSSTKFYFDSILLITLGSHRSILVDHRTKWMVIEPSEHIFQLSRADFNRFKKLLSFPFLLSKKINFSWSRKIESWERSVKWKLLHWNVLQEFNYNIWILYFRQFGRTV